MVRLKDPVEIVVSDEPVETAREVNPSALSSDARAAVTVSHGAATGRLVGFDGEARPLITGIDELSDDVVPALTTVALTASHIGSTVVLLFDRGRLNRPIVIGIVRDSLQRDQADLLGETVCDVDETRLVLSAKREVVLRCGDASITLTQAGKVIIRGNYIVSRSSGYNKIKGAAVDIN
jgi:hypothetical protein